VETALKQPTWCKLGEDMFGMLVERSHPKLPESVLFHHLSRPALLEKERMARLVALELAALSRK
jgi:hypothetical protein